MTRRGLIRPLMPHSCSLVPVSPNPLITVDDLEARTGIPAKTLRRLAREGRIPSHRIGGSIRFDLEAVLETTRADETRDRARRAATQPRPDFEPERPFVVSATELRLGERTFTRGDAFPWRELGLTDADLYVHWRAGTVDAVAPEAPEADVDPVARLRSIAGPSPSRGAPTTHGEALTVALGELDAEIAECVTYLLRDHGTDPRAWPSEALDEIATLRARRDAYEAVAQHARRKHFDWASTKLPKEK